MGGLFIILLIFLSPFIIVFIILNIVYKKSGAKNTNSRGPIIPLIIFVLIIIIVSIIINLPYSNESDRKNIIEAIEKNEQIIIMADEFIAIFINDSGKANERYKNKIMQITGIIDYVEIPKDNPPNRDNSYITFSDLDDNIIICYFTNNANVLELKNNKENETITIIGKYRRYFKTDKKRIYIELENCEIVNIYKYGAASPNTR
jgi:hypothetical protein